MKSREEHERIFNSYPAAKLKDIIKKSNISLSGLSKAEMVKAMMKRRARFDWLEEYYGVDIYKNHARYKELSEEKDKEEFKKDVKANKKVRKFGGGGRSKVAGGIKPAPKTAQKKAIRNTTYKTVEPRYTEVDGGEQPRGAVQNPIYQTVQPIYTEVFPTPEDTYAQVYPDPD